MSTAHGVHHIEYKMLPGNISTLFAKALKKSEPISGQPMESNLAELREVLSQILLFIPYDKYIGVHNLVGIIQYPTTYTTDHTAVSPRPRKPAIYDESIDNDEKSPLRARKDAIHKAWRSDYTTLKSTERKAGKFILGVVENTLVQDLKKAKTYYTLVTVGRMFAHLQVTCGGLYDLDVIALQN